MKADTNREFDAVIDEAIATEIVKVVVSKNQGLTTFLERCQGAKISLEKDTLEQIFETLQKQKD